MHTHWGGRPAGRLGGGVHAHLGGGQAGRRHAHTGAAGWEEARILGGQVGRRHARALGEQAGRRHACTLTGDGRVTALMVHLHRSPQQPCGLAGFRVLRPLLWPAY